MVGSAVARIVWSSTAGSMASTSAANGRRTDGAGTAGWRAGFVIIDLLRGSSAGRSAEPGRPWLISFDI